MRRQLACLSFNSIFLNTINQTAGIYGFLGIYMRGVITGTLATFKLNRATIFLLISHQSSLEFRVNNIIAPEVELTGLWVQVSPNLFDNYA